MSAFNLPPDLPLVMSYDPGKANGWAMTALPELAWFQAGQGTIDEVADLTEHALYELSRASLSETVVLIESFTVAGLAVASSKTVTVASESIGVLRRIAACHEIRVVMRQPGDRTVITVAHLRELGWHPRGRDHATQAARHLVAYLLAQGLLRVAIGS